MKKLLILLAIILQSWLITPQIVSAQEEITFSMELPAQAVVGDVNLTTKFSRELPSIYKPVLDIRWIKQPAAQSPEYLVGFPATVITFTQPGIYILEAELGTIHKTS